MEIAMRDLSGGERYKILASLVTPRPIAWVSTMDGLGRVNAAPFSFFNVFGSSPPLVAFAPGNREPTRPGVAAVPKDTARNIREIGEFVVNLVGPDQGEAMVATAASLPEGVSELEAAGLTTAPSQIVKPPRIAEAPVALECVEHTTMEIGMNRLVLGIVKHIHVVDGLVDPETWRLDQSRWSPLGRMASPDWYCRTDAVFEMPRPE
jgi:flavin reductase (DIM6/NTAB) family NADH-FMN oxidoreductase RutF